MKTILGVALGLIVGFVLGGLGPKGDVRNLKKELSEARAIADSGRASAAVPMAIGGLFAARDRAEARAASHALPERKTAAPLGAPTPAPTADTLAGPPDGGAPDGGTSKRGLRGLADDQSFGAIKSAADLRAGQFRAAFLEEAHLNAEQQTGLDAAVKKMNDDFAREGDDIAKLIADKGDKITPRDMADIGVKLLNVYQHADDAFKAAVGPDAMAAAEKTKFDILTQVDVGAFRQLAEAASRLEKPPAALR